MARAGSRSVLAFGSSLRSAPHLDPKDVEEPTYRHFLPQP